MIYFIGADWDSPVKIGMTCGCPFKRMGSLQTGNPHKLNVLNILTGYEGLERFLHKKFLNDKMEGEWFLGKPVKSFLDRLALGDPEKEMAEYFRRPKGYEGLWFETFAFLENSNELAKRYGTNLLDVAFPKSFY